MSEFEIRRATSQDRIQLQAMETELFPSGDAMSMDWQLDGNPAGPGIMLVAVTASGDLAGTRSVLPWRLRVDGREIRVGQYARSWTLPQFRRLGVSVAIGGALDRVMEEAGWPMVFLIPSDRSVPGHRRLGHTLEPLWHRRQFVSAISQVRRAPTWTDGLVRGWQRRRRGVVASGDWSHAGLDHVDWVWERWRPPEPVAGVRDGGFVSWRYGTETGRGYRLLRYPASGNPELLSVIRVSGHTAGILDVWGTAAAESAAAAMVGLIDTLAGEAAVVQWCPPPTAHWTAVAAECGLITRKPPVYIGRIFGPNPPPGLRDVSDYAISEGDSDYA